MNVAMTGVFRTEGEHPRAVANAFRAAGVVVVGASPSAPRPSVCASLGRAIAADVQAVRDWSDGTRTRDLRSHALSWIQCVHDSRPTSSRGSGTTGGLDLLPTHLRDT